MDVLSHLAFRFGKVITLIIGVSLNLLIPQRTLFESVLSAPRDILLVIRKTAETNVKPGNCGDQKLSLLKPHQTR